MGDPAANILVWFGRILPAKGTHVAIAAPNEPNGRWWWRPISDPDYFADKVAPPQLHKTSATPDI